MNRGHAQSIDNVLNEKGAIDCSTNPNYPAAAANHVYRVSVAGKIGGASGRDVAVGDRIICKSSNAGGTEAAVGTGFDIVGAKIAAGGVTNAFLANMVTKTVKGRNTASTGVPEDVTADQLNDWTYTADAISGGSQAATARSNAARWLGGLVVDAMEYGLVLGGTTTQHTLINAIMADLHQRGGGILLLPPTGSSWIYVSDSIDNQYTNVLVVGTGVHSGVGTISAATRGTTIKGAAGITVLKHRTPSGSGNPQRHGGGFKGIAVLDGARGLHVTSRSGGVYHLLFSGQTGTEAMLMDCLTSPNGFGITQTVSDYGDNQHFDMDVVLELTGSTHGVVMSSDSNGTVRATANTSVSHGMKVRGSTGTGYAVVMDCTDNLIFDYIRVFGPPLLVKGVYNAGGGGDIRFNVDNEVHWIGSSTAVVIEGTDTSGCDAGAFLIINHLDFGNANPQPTVGTGAYALVRNGLGIVRGGLFRPIAIGEGDSSAYNMRNNNWDEDHLIWAENTVSGGYILVFENGPHRWGMKQDGADIDFVKLAGAGGGLKINGALITEGAADSGGAGYALLRVPN